MESVRLALRGLRWRTGSSIAVLAVAIVAMAGAALGPLYAASAADSLVRDSMATSPAVGTGVVSRGNIAGQTQYSPAELRDAVAQRAADPALDPWYLPGSMALVVHDGTITDGSRLVGVAQAGWHRGQCDAGAVTIVQGHCAVEGGEAMVSQRTAKDMGVPLGSVLRLGISSDSKADTVTVVGYYDQASADPVVWGLDSPAQFAPARIEGPPDRLDEIVVGEQTMLDTNGDVAAVSLRRIDAARVHLADLPQLRAAVTAATAIDPSAVPTGPRTLSISGMIEHLDGLQPQLDSVAVAAFAVTAQLVLLAWFVLFLVVAATSDERAGEIALAKLRGMSRRSTLAFGLAEPVLLVLVAVPVGLLIAWAADTVLTHSYLVAGTAVSITWTVVLALAVCFLGAVSAAALAARSILSAPVLEQLRRTGGRRARLARSSAIDAGAVALAAAGIYELKQGGSDALALLAPGLIALAVGLLAVRLLPALARVEVARTRASASVASFLASRNVARRPGGLRIVVLLTLAVALAVFAVDGWTVAAANRGDVARAQVGGSEVLHVRVASPGELLAAVDAADPSGTQALAAVVSDNGTGGLIAADATRLGVLSAWDPAWAGTSREAIGALLHPPQPAKPLVIHGDLTLTAEFTRTQGSTPLTFSVGVRSASGLPYQAKFGIITPGTATYSVPLPPCRETACTLMTFAWTQPVGIPASVIGGKVVLRDVSDAKGVVDLTSVGLTGWRSVDSASPVGGGDAAKVVGSSDGVLTVSIAKAPIDDATIEVADHPIALPVLQGSNQPVQDGGGVYAVTTGLDGGFARAKIEGTGVLPRLLQQGTMADLSYAIAASGTGFDPLDFEVWLSPTASPEVRAALGKLDVVSTESVATTEESLARSGPALALRLFLLAAVVALVLGAGTLLANAYVVIRRRAYELAALRALGADRRVLVRSARREQVVLALTGTLLGAVAGLVAAGFALEALIGADASGLPVWLGPAWTPVVALLLVVLVALVVVADIGARRTVRGAVPELLRQVQE
ncbi:MAG TPA: ABC transporter permease [Candidatus Nanopelagicales bacterium]|nr:ABC transporter permease [Candidatus Nanopelagicales bacterium]